MRSKRHLVNRIENISIQELQREKNGGYENLSYEEKSIWNALENPRSPTAPHTELLKAISK